MTQADRDRLVALKKAKKKLITQKQAADELGITERHVRRLLRALKRRGDKVVAHALRGLPSNRKISADTEEKAIAILSQPVYRGFVPVQEARTDLNPPLAHHRGCPTSLWEPEPPSRESTKSGASTKPYPGTTGSVLFEVWSHVTLQIIWHKSLHAIW